MRSLVAVLLLSGCASSDELPMATTDATTDASGADVTIDVAETTPDVSGEHAIFETEVVTCGNGTLDGEETCDDGNTFDGDGCSADCRLEGCADGTRAGFVDYKAYPNIAACGPAADYAKALMNAPTVCQTGWHMCTLIPKELDTHMPGDTAPAEKFRAWLDSEDTKCALRTTFTNAKCSGDAAAIRPMRGTGACAVKLSCDGGYRAVLDSSAWNVALFGASVCNAHVSAACGYGATAETSLTLCCR